MATTIKRTELDPESYPAAPAGLSTAAAALVTVAWQRIEAYTAYRFSPRSVEFVVEGPGAWSPPLKPATVTAVEVWSRAGEWETAVLDPSPVGGYWLAATGPYRFTCVVGSTGDVPAIINEAVRRLAEYMAAKPGKPGVTSESVSAGSIAIASRRSPNWMASAMDNSGAADLLRNYRRA